MDSTNSSLATFISILSNETDLVTYGCTVYERISKALLAEAEESNALLIELVHCGQGFQELLTRLIKFVKLNIDANVSFSGPDDHRTIARLFLLEHICKGSSPSSILAGASANIGIDYKNKVDSHDLPQSLANAVKKEIPKEFRSFTDSIIVQLHRSNSKDLPKCASSGEAHCLFIDTSQNIGRVQRLMIQKSKDVLQKETIRLLNQKSNTVITGSIETSMNVVMKWIVPTLPFLGRRCRSLERQKWEALFDDYNAPYQGDSVCIGTLTAAVSLILGKPIPSNWAFTGKISSLNRNSKTARVEAVGGIDQKVRAALMAGMSKIFIPAANSTFSSDRGSEKVSEETNKLAGRLQAKIIPVKNINDFINQHILKLQSEPKPFFLNRSIFIIAFIAILIIFSVHSLGPRLSSGYHQFQLQRCLKDPCLSSKDILIAQFQKASGCARSIRYEIQIEKQLKEIASNHNLNCSIKLMRGIELDPKELSPRGADFDDLQCIFQTLHPKIIVYGEYDEGYINCYLKSNSPQEALHTSVPIVNDPFQSEILFPKLTEEKIGSFCFASLGAFYISNNREAAKRLIDEALSIDSKSVPILQLKAYQLYLSKDYRQALEYCNSALQLKSNRAVSLNFKALILRELGRYQEAVACYDEALSFGSDYNTLNNKGVTLDALGKHREAIICYDRALKLNPKCDLACNNRGITLVALGKYNEAVESYDRALQLNPKYAGAWSNRGIALREMGKYQDAIESYDKALKLEPDNAGVLNNKGRTLDSMERYQEAIVCYDRALQLNPKYAMAWNNKGNALHAMGRNRAAIECHDKSLKLEPNYAGGWCNKGNALGDMDRCREAIKCYDKALKLESNDTATLTCKGNVLNKMGRYQEAIECCEKAIVIDRNNAMAWNNKGNAFEFMERRREAIECYDIAIKLCPIYITWFNKGNALRASGRRQEAIICYEKALRLEHCDAGVLTHMGGIFYSLGRRREAIECYKKAIQLNPTIEVAWANMGHALNATGRYNEANECCEKAIELNPNDIVAWIGKGIALDGMGRPNEAIECYNKAIQINPSLETSWFNMAKVLHNMTRYLEAIKCYERTIKLNSQNAMAWRGKGECLEAIGRKKEASRCYKRADILERVKKS